MSTAAPIDLFVFSSVPHGSNWFAIGLNAAGDECWTQNGIIIPDKTLCDRIAANMQRAYEQGMVDAARSFVQHSIKVADMGHGEISNISTGNGWIVRRKNS